MFKTLFLLFFLFLNLFASIDTSQRAITMANLFELDSAKKLAKKFNNFDVYIRQTSQVKQKISYVVYLVNIDRDKRMDILDKIHKKYPTAYATSIRALKLVATNPKKEDIFIPAKKFIEKPTKPIEQKKYVKHLELKQVIQKEKVVQNKIVPKNIPKSKTINSTQTNTKTIQIALVGPLSGKHKASGKDMLRAVSLKISQVNKAGGIDGKKLELITFDDQNDKVLASKMAKKALDSKALAIVGHRWSSTTGKGIEVYKTGPIAVISGTATSTNLTQRNNCFFRSVPNNAQEVQTLAYYLKYILDRNKVVVIYDESSFSKNLYDEFIKIANKIDLKVLDGYKIDKNSKNIEYDAKKIITTIKDKYNDFGIFLATHANQGVPVVYQIREQNLKSPIVASSAVAKVSFAKSFEKYPLELGNPGYYTNNIYCAVSMLFDIGGIKAVEFTQAFKKKFKDDFKKNKNLVVNAANASYYDAISFIIKALKNANLNQDKKTIRKNIIDSLFTMVKPNKGIDGVTGKLYFTENGDIDKQTYIAKFQKQMLGSSLVQISDITNMGLLDYIKKSKKSYFALKRDYPNILKTQTGYLATKKIVKVGFKLHKVSEVDLIKKTAKLNFDIWLISKDNIDLNELYFTNAIDTIKLENPTKFKKTDQYIYQRYRIDAKFSINFDTTKYNVNQYLAGFTFSTKRKGTQELQLVPDILNLQYYSGDDFVQNIKKEQIFTDDSLKIRTANFFQDIKKVDALANPLLTQIGINNYNISNVNLLIVFDQKSFDVNSYISYENSKYIVLISITILILLNYIIKFLFKKQFLSLYNLKINFIFFIIKVILVYAILFAGEVFIIDFARNYIDRPALETLALGINIIRIMINAILINSLLYHIIWLPLSKRTNKNVPPLLKNMITFLIYLAAFLIVYKYILFQDLTSLLASMGVLAMVIGFAVQANINNIFSGLALNIENSIDIGDWIEFEGYPEGQVVDINWRTTTVKCRDGRLVNIPNAVASESPLTNFSKSDKLAQVITIDINMKHDPEQVKAILLKTMNDIDGITKDPKPKTGLKYIDEWEVRYKLVYHIEVYDERFDIEQIVWSNLWRCLKETGIEPSIRKSEIKLVRDIKK